MTEPVLLRDGPTGVMHEHGPIRNPFKQPVLKGQFDAIISVYDKRHKDIVRQMRDGRYRRHLGNAWANSFWRGFDGVQPGRWDAASKQSTAYACWRAGVSLRAALPELAARAIDEPIFDGAAPRIHSYNPDSDTPMPPAAREQHEYDPAMDYEAQEPPRILLGMLENVYGRLNTGILPALGMEGAVVFFHDDPEDCVGRYVFGTSGYPVLGIDIDRIQNGAADVENEIETTIVHELAHAWLEPRIDEDLMMDHDQGMEDAVEAFARTWTDTGVADLTPLEVYAASVEPEDRPGL